jgi:hypothetical protein
MSYRDDSEQPNSRHRNPKDMKDEYNRTLGLIEQDQIKENDTTRSDFDAYKVLDSTSKDFAKLDSPSDGMPKADSEPIIPESMSRFCHEHSFESETLTQGNKTENTPAHAKLDKPSD